MQEFVMLPNASQFYAEDAGTSRRQFSPTRSQNEPLEYIAASILFVFCLAKGQQEYAVL